MSPKQEAPISRAAQKVETRQGLLAAARRVFDAKGYSRTLVGDIAREARVAHGTFYVHFTNKEAIADALLMELNASLSARIAAELEAHEGELAQLVNRAAGAFLQVLEEQKDFVAWYTERAGLGLSTDALSSGINPPAVSLLSLALEGLARSRGLELGSTSVVAHGLLALWLRVALQWLLAGAVSRAEAERLLTILTTGAVEGWLTESCPRPSPTPEAIQHPSSEKPHA